MKTTVSIRIQARADQPKVCFNTCMNLLPLAETSFTVFVSHEHSDYFDQWSARLL